MTSRDWADIIIVVALAAPWLVLVALIVVAVIHDGELKELANRVEALETREDKRDRARWAKGD